MTTEQRDAIEAHGQQLLALFPNAAERDPVKLCKRLRRLELEAHRFAESLCNNWLGTSEQAERATERILFKVRALLGCGADPDAAGPPIFLNADPRGYALKIRPADLTGNLYQDWGGYGILAPDLTARSNHI